MFLDYDEMKFTILYTLEKFVEPISMPQLCDILAWEKQVMNYFDVSVTLNELIEDGFAESKFYRDERAFLLTEKGAETNKFFFERIPKSVRNRIDSAISAVKFSEQLDPNSVNSEIIPIAPHQYMAALSMLDANTPMLEVKIHSGNRSDSEKAARILKDNADEIYKYLIEMIMNESQST